MACIGISGLVTAIAAYFELSIYWQITVFILANVIIFWKLRPFFIKHLYGPEEETATNVHALIGKKGKVIQEVSTDNPGRVKVGGEDWMAVSSNGEKHEVGEQVEVIKVDGAKLIVK